jgi:hypothetical protein
MNSVKYTPAFTTLTFTHLSLPMVLICFGVSLALFFCIFQGDPESDSHSVAAVVSELADIQLTNIAHLGFSLN